MNRKLIGLLLFSLSVCLSTVSSSESGKEESLNYEKGLKEVKRYIQEKNFKEAENILKNLLVVYPDNFELQSILARVLFWQKKFDESIENFKKALSIKEDENLEKELEKVEIARELDRADELIKKGDFTSAEELLKKLYVEKRGEYDSGYRLGMLYIKKRDYEKASKIFKELILGFPQDIGFKALYVESLILEGDVEKAKKELELFSEYERSYLLKERIDLFYRVRRNSAKIKLGYFPYSYGGSEDREFRLEVSQRIKNITFFLSPSRIHRFGQYDNQINMETYSKIGERTKRWGYILLSFSPDHDFLPKSVFGGEIYQGYKNWEFSLGYFRMNFSNVSVNILIPGFTVYLIHGLSLNERFYIVPDKDSFSFLSTLYYEPNPKIRTFYSLSLGKLSGRIESIPDIERINTISGRFVIEWRPRPPYGFGIEIHYEERKNFYRKYGLILFTGFWW